MVTGDVGTIPVEGMVAFPLTGQMAKNIDRSKPVRIVSDDGIHKKVSYTKKGGGTAVATIRAFSMTGEEPLPLLAETRGRMMQVLEPVGEPSGGTGGQTIPRTKKEQGKVPAVVWRQVLAIVKNRMKSRGDEQPTDDDFSLAFATAISSARERGLLKGTGFALSKKGEKAERAKLASADNEEKEAEYRRLLGRRRISTLVARTATASKTAGSRTMDTAVGLVAREARDLAHTAGNRIQEVIDAIRKA
jgi:hypothetical protein